MTKSRNTAIASKYDGLLASFYDADHAWRDYRGQSLFFRSLFPRARKVRVLDICCGTGAHAMYVAGSGFEVTGIDISSGLLKEARKKISRSSLPVTFHKKDVFSPGFRKIFAGNFDGAMLLGWTVAMEPIYNRIRELLDAVWRVLKQGGFFVFDVPIGYASCQQSPGPFHYRLPSGLEGVLRIREKRSPAGGVRSFFYDWDVAKVHTRARKTTRLKLRSSETLKILEPDDVLSQIRNSGKPFQIMGKFRDYHSGLDYRKGDKNMVIVLKKNVLRH